MNRKKIGITTFHTALNYGAIFQTFALQKFLLNNGIDNEIIDYDCKYIKDCYKPFHVSNGRFINSIARGLLFGKNIKKRNKRFEKFVSENIVLSSKKYTSIEEMQKNADDYYCYITGSDQVWSPISAGFDKFYFLPFASPNQKYSYAASIGLNSVDNKVKNEYRQYLKDFSCFSVREDSAKTILKEIFPEKEIIVNVDPTLLLDKNEWSKIIDKRQLDFDYVLLFNVEKEIDDLEFAKELAKKKNLKLVYINDRTIKKDKDIIYYEAPDPKTFLSLFYYASSIVSNSFHGTVFSILFEKDFFIELNNQKTRNIRSEALLEKLKIEGREIINNNLNMNTKEINWNYVREILNNEREKSKKYLLSIIQKEVNHE